MLCGADVSMNQIRTLMPELVSNTRCTIHGVPDVLRIYLQGEFILDAHILLSLSLSLNQLVEYMENNNLLEEGQSGFRARHSCETALQWVVSD